MLAVLPRREGCWLKECTRHVLGYMSTGASIRTSTMGLFCSRARRTSSAAFFFLGVSAVLLPAAGKADRSRPQPHQHELRADGRLYLDDPLQKLIKEVPELKGIRAAENQEGLPAILRRTGQEVDQFFDNVVDLVAHEEIRQERDGIRSAGRPVEDNYLILRRKEEDEVTRFDEFRMNDKGERIDERVARSGFLVTSGFALIGMQFSTALQAESKFRYLGEQKVGKRETYAVAFAQLPGQADLAVTMRRSDGVEVHMLMQGVAWVDREHFHIVRMRTDLLSPQPGDGLEEQTTKVDFSEVRLQDLATPLWLPKEVVVYLKVGRSPRTPFEVGFKNIHHYTDYRRYRVTTKMVEPQ